MTDGHMDARLRAAGERWRADNEAPAGVDVAATVAAREPEIVTPASAPRRQRHWGLYASAAVVAAALVVGGALVLPGSNHPTGNPESDNAGLVGTVWELVGYDDGNQPLRDSSNATFYIGKDGQLVADDSCAVVGGKAATTGGQVTVTDEVVRYRSCTDSVGEMVFTAGGTKILDGTADFAVDGHTMTISRAGNTMHFVAAPPGLPAPSLDVPTFVGAHWKLVKAVDVNGNDVPVTGDVPFFVADDGTLAASDGCNQLTGTVSGIGRVRFDNVGGTEIGCPPAQTVIQAMLTGTADEQVLGATMSLHKAGVGELTYQWVPADTTASDPQALYANPWQLTLVAGQPAVSDARLTVHGNVYSANDGCQDFTGHTSVVPGSIAFTGVPQGSPPCGGAGRDQASTIDSFLDTGGLWAVRDGDLVIWDAASGQAFSLVFTSGSAPPPTVTNPGAALIGRDWFLTYVEPDIRGTGPAYQANVRVTLSFDSDGGARLADSCVDTDWTARFTEQTVEFADGHAETHSCPSGPGLVHDQETVVHQVLDGSATWRLEGHQLTITNGNNALVFRDASTAPTSILGAKWKLTGFDITPNPAGGGSELRGGSIEFGDDGTFVARGGCAPVHGRADINGADVTFSDVSVIGGGVCIDLSGDQERAFAQVLGGTASLDLTDGQLTLSRRDAALHFVRE